MFPFLPLYRLRCVILPETGHLAHLTLTLAFSSQGLGHPFFFVRRPRSQSCV